MKELNFPDSVTRETTKKKQRENDKLNYTKKLKEDIFINMFFFLIFKKITTQTPILKINYFQNLLKNSNKFYKISTKFHFLKSLKNKISFFKKNKASYMGKI